MDKKTMRHLGLSLLFTALSYGGVKAQTPETISKDMKTDAFYSPKQLIDAMKTAEISIAEANKFATYYQQYMDDKCHTDSETLVKCAKQAGLSVEKTKEILNNLNGNKQGYNCGGYDFMYRIASDGHLSRLDFKSGNDFDRLDIQEVHHARCRHCRLAVDDSKAEFESKKFIIKLLVYQDVRQKLKDGKTVINGDKYIKRFEDDLEKNGLAIGKDNRLHGIESSRENPLYTKNDLLKEYKQQQEMIYQKFAQSR